MMFLLFFLCLPLLFGVSVKISSVRPYLGKERMLQEGNFTEDVSKFMFDNMQTTKSFTSGFVRTDTYDWVQSTWIQAQVLPIGACFKEGSQGGSAKIAQVTMNTHSILRVTNVYEAPDCSGDFSSVPFMLPIAETSNQFEYIIKHVQDIGMALEINPPFADGLLITSYYSSEGCTGEAAQYDLVSTDCMVYDFPIGAYGTFQCDMEAEMMVLTLYGPYDGDAYTYPSCQPYTGFDDASREFEYGDAYGYGYGRYNDVDIIKQPFQCTDESAIGSELENFPYYQTVRCVQGKSFPEEDSQTYSSASTESESFTDSESSDDLANLSSEDLDPQEEMFYAAVQAYKAARLVAGSIDDYDFELGSEAEELFNTAVEMFRAARSDDTAVEEFSPSSSSSSSYADDEDDDGERSH